MPISHMGLTRAEKYNHLRLHPPPGGGVTLLPRLLEQPAAVRLCDDAGQEVPGQQVGGARRGETEITSYSRVTAANICPRNLPYYVCFWANPPLVQTSFMNGP